MTLRGRYEGSIFQRSNGRWVAMISLPGGQRKTLYGKTRLEVQRKLAAAQRDVEMGIPVISDQQTVAQYLLSWLETTKPTIEFTSWNRNRQYVELHIIPQVGQTRLRELTPQQVQQLYSNRINAGLSSSTVRHLHATLHKALKDAERLGLVARNVCKLVNAPRMAESEIHPLSPAQAQLLLRTVAGTPIEPLYVTALATGMRLSELLGLFWADMNLDARPTPVIHVRRQLKRVAGAWAWKDPKTKRSRRQIALPARVADVLRSHQLHQEAERVRLGTLWEDYNLVFCTQTGGPLIPGNVYRQLMRVLKRAGLPHIRFHDLRHTCATMLLSARVNPKVVSEMLGHASVTITLDIYSHVLPDMQQDAAEAMDHFLDGARETLKAPPPSPLSSTTRATLDTVTALDTVATSDGPDTSDSAGTSQDHDEDHGHELLSNLLSIASSSTTVHPH